MVMGSKMGAALQTAGRPIKATLALTALAIAAPVFAWSNQGHMATGAVAYDDLARSDPGAVTAIVAIMAHHPDRARFARVLVGTNGAARDRRLFEYMARWPDDARETSWDHPKWHYSGRIVKGWTVLSFTVGQADSAFAQNLQIAGDVRARPRDRAVALCWLLHIMGDMHQPLHAGHRADAAWPNSDRMGTIAWVRKSARDIEMPLHQLWDKSLDLAGDEAAGADRIAAAVERVRLNPGDTAVGRDLALAFAGWTAESAALARRFAYGPAVDGASHGPAAAPVVEARYQQAMRRLALARIGQAGHRIAAVFARII